MAAVGGGSGFSRIFRTLVDAFPSSGAGPIIAPARVSDDVQLVHEVSHIFARADERNVVQTAGPAGSNVVNLNGGNPVPRGKVQLILGAAAFHDDPVARFIEFYIIDTSGTNLAYQLRSSQDYRAAAIPAQSIFGLDSVAPLIMTPGFMLRVFVPNIAAGQIITGTVCYIEAPFQELPVGP